MPKALLDSTTYIDLENAGRHRRESWAGNTIQNALGYRTRHGKPATGIVSVVEILKGLHRAVDPAKALMFKNTVAPNFEFLDVTTDIGYLASEIIAKLEDGRQTIGFPDGLIAATAIQCGLILITSNQRHFQRVADLGFPLALSNWRTA